MKLYGFPELPLDAWSCTMAQASLLALPKKLSQAAAFLGMPQQKSSSKVMMLLSQPNKKTGKVSQGTPEQLEELYAYCAQDSLVEREIMHALPLMSKAERKVWLVDQKMNDRGILVDRDFAIKALACWEKYEPSLNNEIMGLTEGKATGTQVAALKVWLTEQLGRSVTSLDKAFIAQSLADPNLPPNVRRVLELRSELGAASLKKFNKIVTGSDPVDHRARGTMRYHSASTGRWAGYLIQPQNLSRPTIDISQVEAAKHLTEQGDTDSLNLIFGDATKTISSLVRPTIIAPKGKILLCVDYNAIEARCLAWVADEKGILNAYAMKQDPYVDMAAKIFAKPKEDVTKHERFIGKSTILGAGYGMGHVKFRETLKASVAVTEEFAKGCIDTYRSSNPNIVKLWRTLDSGIKSCIRNHQPVLLVSTPCEIRCRIEVDHTNTPTWLFIQLPVGRELAYYRPRLAKGEYGDEIRYTAVDNQTGNPMTAKLYGGALCLSQGTKVLTDVGLVPIQEITKRHKLWDGDNWVTHDGLIYQGELETISRWGVSMTADHRVLTKKGWENASQLSRYSEPDIRLPDYHSIRGVEREKESVGSQMRMRQVSAETLRGFYQVSPWDFVRLQKEAQRKNARDEPSPSLRGMEINVGSMQAANTPSISQLRSEGDHSLRAMGELRELLGGYGANIQKGSIYRASGQRERLYERQLLLGDNGNPSEQQTRYEAPNTRHDHKAVFADLRHQANNPLLPNRTRMARRYDGQPSGRLKPCYDILNAGPQHRFTVVGDRPFLSHNCENIIQAIARDIMANAMLSLDSAGYEIVLTVHDEIVIEGEESDQAAVECIMTTLPDWAPGLPLAVESSVNPFYWK